MRPTLEMVRTTVLAAAALWTIGCEAASPPAPPTIALAPTSVSFAGVQGGSNPAAQTVSVSNSGGSALNWAATTAASWLTITPSSGTAPGTITLTPNIAGLAAGNLSATVEITGAGATNSPLTVVAGLALAPPPSIALSPSTFAFSGQQGASNPATQTLSVSNGGGGTLSWTAGSNASWLTLSPASGSGAGSVTLSASTSGLSAGTYDAVVTIAATGAANTPQTANVTLTVTAAPAIALSANAFTFTGTQGGASPAAQTLTISNSGGGTLAWSVTDDATWLSLSPASGTSTGAVTLTPNTAGLPAGTYTGTISVTAAGASNSPQTADVTLTVAANYNGSWAGKTAIDSTITFQVQNNGITTISIGYHATGGNCTVDGRSTTTFTTPVPITNASFSRSVTGNPTSYTISGTFNSASAASGDLTVNFSQSIPGQPSCTASSSTTWTASRQ